jgi:UDP-glucose 4-epimerase
MTPPAIQRALILGHSGFIGLRVVEQFRLRTPEVECVGHSFPETDLTLFDGLESLARSMDEHTAVLMLSGIKRQLGDTLDIFEQNLKMVANLARLLDEHPVARVVYVSSAAVYGEEVDNTRITEDTPVHPMSLYGIAKHASECLLQNVASRHPGTSLVSIRPPLVYGPGDASRSYGPSAFVKSAVEGKEIVLWGDGAELREFLFLEDLACIIHGLTFSACDGVLNAVAGQSHTFKDVVEILNRECGGKLVVSTRSRSKGRVDNAFVNQRLVTALPDLKFTSLEDGIRQALAAERHSAGRA